MSWLPKESLVLLVLLGTALRLCGAYPPVLGLPQLQSGRIEYELAGETLGIYVLESSSNLIDWIAIATNQDRASRRFLSAPAAGSSSFARALWHPANRSRFALATGLGIELNGNNLLVDSYHSKDPRYSTDGGYDPAKAKDEAEVAAHTTVGDSLGGGTLTILGRLHRLPDTVVSIGPQWAIGSRPWVYGGNLGIQPGFAFDDLDMGFPETMRPFSGGAYTPSSGVIEGAPYTYVLGDAHYQLSSLNLNSTMRIAVVGNATLYITGDVFISGSASIQLFPGGRLSLFAAGANARFGGAGVDNPSGPEAFSIFCLPTVSTLTLPIANASLAAMIYAPNTELAIGGPIDADFFGSCTVRSATLHGHVRFHYDESLAY